ncbi:MAG: 30S ribosomal protein S7 [Candidatus Shikimatogenerans sp. JK-2022]|nr:30S ribosomal protein S7 [Candidatus Shikimatogenerans bostrichidophilus]
MRKIKLKKTKKYIKDFKYKSKLVSYFVNILMRNGKKNLAFRIFYKTLNIIKKKNKKKNIKSIKILKKALKNISPKIIIKNKKIGGTTYNIPIKINKNKQKYLSIKWLILFSKKKKGNNMSIKLAKEILLAYKGLGESIKKKNEIYKIAEANKAFTYFKF